MKMVGPVGLEPTTKGFTIIRTRFCCRRKVTIFLSLYRFQTETEPIPNLIMGDSGQVAGKLKKRDEFSKPKSELLPKRVTESVVCISTMFRVSCVIDHATVVTAQLRWSADSGHVISGLTFLHNGVECDQ